jgi:hypothetical protein
MGCVAIACRPARAGMGEYVGGRPPSRRGDHGAAVACAGAPACRRSCTAQAAGAPAKDATGGRGPIGQAAAVADAGGRRRRVSSLLLQFPPADRSIVVGFPGPAGGHTSIGSPAPRAAVDAARRGAARAHQLRRARRPWRED